MPPSDHGKVQIVRRYLLDERALPADLVQLLFDCGRLYADPRANAVFVLLGSDGAPGAELRGTVATSWRGLATGSRKDLGYFSVPAPDTATVVLCESAIDAISCLALHPGCLCISTSGARPNPAWLPSLIRRDHEIYCGFDRAAAVVQQVLSAMPAGGRSSFPLPFEDMTLAHHVLLTRPSLPIKPSA